MNATARIKAAKALTTAKHQGDYWWFPKIYIVGEDVYFTENAAILAVKHGQILDGVTYTIEEMTFAEAWKIRHGKEVPKKELEHICTNI